MIRRPPRSTLFPYTPLSRSNQKSLKLDAQKPPRGIAPAAREEEEPGGEERHGEDEECFVGHGRETARQARRHANASGGAGRSRRGGTGSGARAGGAPGTPAPLGAGPFSAPGAAPLRGACCSCAPRGCARAGGGL